VILAINNGKTIKNNFINYIKVYKSKDVKRYFLRVLIIYFYLRFNVHGKRLPYFNKKQNWYRIKVLFTNGKIKEFMFYITQAAAIKKTLKAAGIDSSKITYIKRKSAVRRAEL